jgi:F420-dependent oxidoreductase-like protein
VSEPAHPIRVGLKLIPQLRELDDLRGVWAVADDAGFDHCWVYDHLLAVAGAPEEGDVFDGWTLVAAMAASTSRVRIGTLVAGNTYRHPGVLAKIAVTVDHLSGGRLELGLGAGWNEREHAMLGLDFGTAGERVARLDESCRVLKQLWTEERSTFSGSFYRLDDAVANPKPLQRPHPPLWIGGRGERKLLRVVARHADVWNTPAVDVDEDVRLLGVLDRYCDEIGRDPAEIRRTIQLYYRGDADDVVARAERYAAAGFSEFVLAVYAEPPVAAAEAIAADVLPRLRALDRVGAG